MSDDPLKPISELAADVESGVAGAEKAALTHLLARCMYLESQVAALAAFACAAIEVSGSKRDELETRWTKHLGPAMIKMGHFDEDHKSVSAAFPAWLLAYLRHETL